MVKNELKSVCYHILANLDFDSFKQLLPILTYLLSIFIIEFKPNAKGLKELDAYKNFNYIIIKIR